MKDSENRCYEMFLSVREYGTTQTVRFPPTSYTGEVFASLTDIINQLEAQATAQSSGKSRVKESSQSKAASRDALKRSLEAISRTASILALTIPGLENKFRSPSGLKDQELLTLARMASAEAPPFKADFIKRGLKPNFIEELDGETNAFEEAITRKIKGKETQVTATATIDQLIERGLKCVRELDVIMRNTFADDPTSLAVWLSASHIERHAPRPRKKTTPETEKKAS